MALAQAPPLPTVQDSNFEIVNTELKSVQVPLGDLNVAEATRNVILGGALSPLGNAATHEIGVDRRSVLRDQAVESVGVATAVAPQELTFIPGVRGFGHVCRSRVRCGHLRSSHAPPYP